MGISLEEVLRWDKDDPLRAHRGAFALSDQAIYLDGNSLGPPPRATQARLAGLVAKEWGEGLIDSWGGGWMAAPTRVGAKIAPLLGAAPDEVVVADSTSVNLFKLCAAALGLRPGRQKLLTEAGDFPTCRHVLDGLARLVPGLRVEAVDAGALPAALDGATAVLLLPHVHYTTGARQDMAALNRAARDAGAIAVWDLSHSAGAIPVALHADGAEMAAACGYKFLNGGPGAPAFLYVARHLQAEARSPLQGWIGHEQPFAFSDVYAPAPGVARFLSGTPGVLGLAALECGVDVFTSVDQAALWRKSERLFDLFVKLCPGLDLITPRDAGRRGSHVSFRRAGARAIMDELARRGVTGDFRPPDVMRFGLTPLYTRYEDVWLAAEALKDVLS